MKKNKINRTDLINQLSNKLGISQSQTENFLMSTIEIITENLKSEKEVHLTGFGSFRIVRRKGRMGINPKTGEALKINPSISVGFKVGKTLKENIRKIIKK